MSNADKTPRNPAEDEALLRGALPIEIHGRLRSARIVENRAVVVAEAGDLGAKAREELEGLIENALSELKAISPDTVNSYAGKTIVFKIGEREMPFTAEHFVLSFSLPNFYFHCTTCYDLLRKRGVALGKIDYLGQMKISR